MRPTEADVGRSARLPQTRKLARDSWFKSTLPHSKIRVAHHRKYLKDCNVRVYRIRGKKRWGARIVRAHVRIPRYHNPGGWKDTYHAYPHTLEGYKPTPGELKHIEKLRQKGVPPVITVARWKDFEIIVDGTHRAIGLTNGMIKFPVTVIEYSGPMVPHTFWAEFICAFVSVWDLTGP